MWKQCLFHVCVLCIQVTACMHVDSCIQRHACDTNIEHDITHEVLVRWNLYHLVVFENSHKYNKHTTVSILISLKKYCLSKQVGILSCFQVRWRSCYTLSNSVWMDVISQLPWASNYTLKASNHTKAIVIDVISILFVGWSKLNVGQLYSYSMKKAEWKCKTIPLDVSWH